MITESFQSYKGYTIRLRAVTNGGFGYAIIKYTPNESSPNGQKAIYLRKEVYTYINPDILLSKAKNYIDNFEDMLIIKFNKLTPIDLKKEIKQQENETDKIS